MSATKQLCNVLMILTAGLLLLACENPAGSDGGGENGGGGNGGNETGVSIDTESAADVGNHTATLQGNLADLGDFDSVDVAFQYREAKVSDWGDSSQVTETEPQTLNEAGSFDGDFSKEIDGLTGDTDGETDYEFRAVAYDGEDLIVAGDAASFMTNGPGHTDRVLALATDDTYLYTASDDMTVHKVDVSGPEPERVWVYKGHTDAVTALAVHPDTGKLYTGSDDGISGKGEIHIIDPTGESPTQVNTYTPRPFGGIKDLVFDGNDLYLAAGQIDKVDTSDNENLTEPWTDDYKPTQKLKLQALAVDPNEDVIYAAAGDGSDNGGELHRISDVNTSSPDVDWTEGGALQRIRAVAAVDESGSTVLYTGADDASLRKYDAGDDSGLGDEQWGEEYGAVNNLTSIVLDDNGNVISGSHGAPFNYGQVRKSDPSDGTREWLYSEHANYVYDVAVGPNGNIYSASRSSEVHRIDPDTGTKVWHYR